MFGRKKVANVIVVEQPKAETIGTGIIIGSVGVAAGGALLKVTRKAVRFIFKGIYDTAKMIGGKISDWWARRKSEAEAERVAAEAAQAGDRLHSRAGCATGRGRLRPEAAESRRKGRQSLGGGLRRIA